MPDTLGNVTNSDSIDSSDAMVSDSLNSLDPKNGSSSLKGTETINVRMADASTSKVRVFPSEKNPQGDDHAGRPLVIMWPGWGMGARYYDPMGRELASRGFNVATGELHGQGSSTARATRTKRWGYHEMASQDYPRTIRAAKEHFGLREDHPVILLCHSMGGQVGSLFLARPDIADHNVKGMVGVGAGTPYYPGFSGATRYQLQYGAPMMRLITKILGYQPEGRFDIAGYGRQSGTHVKEWYRLSRTNRFINLHGADQDYQAELKNVTTPVLLLRFSNDYDCPTRSAKNLASMLPKAKLATRQEVGPEVETIEGKLGHNRWAREPEVIASRIEDFVKSLDS